MQYKPSLVSPPISYPDRYIMDINTNGDTMNISLDTEFWRELTLDVPRKVNVLPKPSVSIVEKNDSVIDTITLGESFDVTVKLSEAVSTDVSIDFTISSTIIPSWNETRKFQDMRGTPDTFDYSKLIQPLDLVNLDITTGTITIPAGTLEASVTITSTPALEMFYGKGSFYCCDVTLSNPSPEVMLSNVRQSYVLLEDNFTYPKWGGLEVELWGKMPDLSYFQPIFDPETSSTVKWTFDYSKNPDDTLADTTLRTKIIDDVPLESIQLRPVDIDGVATDLENVGAEVDLSLKPPFYKLVVMCGRRD